MSKVQSIDRAFNILEKISTYDDGIGISNLSKEVNLNKSTVHRIVGCLIDNGYVKQMQDLKYITTYKLYEIGVRSISRLNIAGASKETIKKLATDVGEVIHLAIRSGNEIIYIDKEVPSFNIALMGSSIYSTAPIYSTAAGKSMLFDLSESDIESLWETFDIEPKTQNTITSLENFKKNIKNSISKGYATDNEENELGIFCIASPIYNYQNTVCAAISLSAPTERMLKNMERYIKAIKKAASEISGKMGYLN